MLLILRRTSVFFSPPHSGKIASLQMEIGKAFASSSVPTSSSLLTKVWIKWCRRPKCTCWWESIDFSLSFLTRRSFHRLFAAEIDPKERLARQRKLLQKKLGLDIGAAIGMDTEELFNDEDLDCSCPTSGVGSHGSKSMAGSSSRNHSVSLTPAWFKSEKKGMLCYVHLWWTRRGPSENRLFWMWRLH